MNVLQVLPALESGGVERGTLEIARALVASGHGSYVMSEGGKLVRQLEQEGSSHIPLATGKKNPLTFLKAFKLRKLLQQYKIDVVHVRSRMPAWVVYFAWKMMDQNTRPRLITTVHGLYSINGYSAVMTKGEYIVAVSRTIQQYIRDNYPTTDSNKIVLIPRGVESDEFPYHYQPNADWLASWKRQVPAAIDSFVVTLPGRITRLKGHLDFVRVIAELKRRGVPVTGLVVGGAHPRKQQYLQEVKAAVNEANLQQDIVFLGNRADIRDILSVSSVALSLSNQPESFGRTTLEAIKLGVPVVAYDHGGVGEILRDTFPAGLVSLSDVDAVVNKLEEFYRQPPRVDATDLYQLSSMLEKTVALYERAHAERKSTGSS